MHEHRRGEPRRQSGGGDRRLEPARRDEMGRHLVGKRLAELGGVEKPVAFERRAGKERRREPGREAAMVVRGEKRQDAVAGRDPRRDEEGDDRGDERGGGAMERARLPAAAPEGDEAGLVRRRSPPPARTRAPPSFTSTRSRSITPSGTPGPVGEEEPQPERARRDPAQDLGRAVLGEPPEADDGRDPRGEKRPFELDLAPRRWQKARAVTGLLDGQDGQRRLGRARQADPDRAPGLEAERRKRRRQPSDDLDGEGIAPFEPGRPHHASRPG